jgi:methionyl-tRNA formyltransferase
MKFYVFIQNEPFLLPKVLDKVLRDFGDDCAGVNIQSVAQGKRSVVGTAVDLWKLYGFRYFQWKLRSFLWKKVQARLVNGVLGLTNTCHSVGAVAKKYGVEVTEAVNVNSDAFLSHLQEREVEFILSVSGTQFYGKRLRDQTPRGIVNCHGALLPKYRGLMPSFWTLANGEAEGGVTVHFVNEKLDDGSILLQKRYAIKAHDCLEDVMARSKDLAAEVIIECMHLVRRGVQAGDPETMPNDEAEATHFSMPGKADMRRFRERGHRLR